MSKQGGGQKQSPYAHPFVPPAPAGASSAQQQPSTPRAQRGGSRSPVSTPGTAQRRFIRVAESVLSTPQKGGGADDDAYLADPYWTLPQWQQGYSAYLATKSPTYQRLLRMVHPGDRAFMDAVRGHLLTELRDVQSGWTVEKAKKLNEFITHIIRLLVEMNTLYMEPIQAGVDQSVAKSKSRRPTYDPQAVQKEFPGLNALVEQIKLLVTVFDVVNSPADQQKKAQYTRRVHQLIQKLNPSGASSR